MNQLPLWTHLIAIIALLLISGFFSISETSMMAVNRYRLRHLAQQGKSGAKRVLSLLNQTDRLLATILLGNNLVNAALTALVTALAIQSFGNNDTVLAIATALVAMAIIIFAEITPKIIGASRPEPIAMAASLVLAPLIRFGYPLVIVVNTLVSGLIRMIGLRKVTQAGNQQAMSTQELRTAILESTRLIPAKHRSIMLNLFDIEDLTVDDVMVPRSRIEALDLESDAQTLIDQLTTCFHNKLPVFEGDIHNIVGILHVRKAMGLLSREGFNRDAIRETLIEPYFVPSGTPLFTQLQYFQENKQRIGLVVDEYGEIEGLVTLEDIIEELVGEFTTNAPGDQSTGLHWDADGTIVVDGTSPVRDLNRRLGIQLPTDGARTLNGLLLETLQDLPDAHVSVKISDVPMEILQTQGRVIRRVRLIRPSAEAGH
ncbi:MAG: HlyC/CorC family transporter [Burkholderiaceae bacterium]|nr:HlyC/CorC family transporter [Burkholderiaceae bacterium]